HRRGVRPDLHDVADPYDSPRPEARGAIVLSATQDSDSAWETRGSDAQFHGVFSWAWIRAVRAAAPNEAVLETFIRAQSLMRRERPDQVPVLAGNAHAKATPFLGTEPVGYTARESLRNTTTSSYSLAIRRCRDGKWVRRLN